MGYSNPFEWGQPPGSSRGSDTESEPYELKESNPLVCRSPRSSTSVQSGGIEFTPFPSKKNKNAWKKISNCFSNCCCCALPGSEKAIIRAALGMGRLDIQLLWETQTGRLAIKELMVERKARENCIVLEKIEAYDRLVKFGKNLDSMKNSYNAILRDHIYSGNLNISSDLILDFRSISSDEVITEIDMLGRFAKIELEIFQQVANNFRNSNQHKKLQKKFKPMAKEAG